MAEAGFQVFDEDGNVILSITDRPYKIFSYTIDVGTTTSGDVVRPTMNGSNNYRLTATQDDPQNKLPPVSKIEGGRVKWDYGSIPNSDRDSTFKLNVMVF